MQQEQVVHYGQGQPIIQQPGYYGYSGGHLPAYEQPGGPPPQGYIQPGGPPPAYS